MAIDPHAPRDVEEAGRERLVIFDTTLRDGEQAPGCSMNGREKLRIARALAELGVDVIEAGFPAASQGDFEAVRPSPPRSRGRRSAVWRVAAIVISNAPGQRCRRPRRPRIHTFIATSPIHRKYKLEMGCEEVLRRAIQGVRTARALCADVEFSAEDASRTEPAFLAEVLTAVIEAGATTVNIPDTVGYAVPAEFAA